MSVFSRACVVTAAEKAGKPDGTGCGLLIDTHNGYIIAHSFVLADLISEQFQQNVNCPMKQISNNLSNANIEVIMEKQSSVKQELCSLHKLQTALANSTVTEKVPVATTYAARLLSIFKCVKFERVLQRLMPKESWRFTDNSNNASNEDEAATIEAYKLLPYFILLQLSNWTRYDSVLTVRPTQLCEIGDIVELVATPFANCFSNIMLNSISRGIVSNLAGENQCLILTDARCIPGSEGGPLYIYQDNEKYLMGVIVSSMCWKGGEWLGFSISCSLAEILACLPENFLKSSDICISKRSQSVKGITSAFTMIQDRVPLVKIGSTWGSGVIIAPDLGLILTCSHVIKDSHIAKVQLRLRPKTALMDARILHQSSSRTQFDLAVLYSRKVAAQVLNQSLLGPVKPVEGVRVFVVGHATFGDGLDLEPSMTSGVVSKVISINNIPIMIQTTCAVHPGTSGGALIDEHGHLIGLVVCNAKDVDSGACFPHVNMCIPLVTVWPVILSYIRTRDVKDFQHLILRNDAINRLWLLGQQVAGSTNVCSHL